MGVQILMEAGEWRDVGEVRNVTWEPLEPESATEHVTMSTGSQFSLEMKYDGEASQLRELIERLEREARWKRWSERTWLNVPYRVRRYLAGHVLPPLSVELLPWQERIAAAALSGKQLTLDWGRRG